MRIDLPESRARVACASWSTNRGKGTWQIDRLAESHPDVTFVLCGRFDTIEPRPNVVRLGHLDRDRMAEALRSCDVFLNLSENDPCPNVVIEALASGLPVQVGAQVGETAILSAAGRHLAAHLPNVCAVEGSFGRLLLADDVAPDEIAFGYGGQAPLLDGVGLGVAVDDAALERLAVDRLHLERGR